MAIISGYNGPMDTAMKFIPAAEFRNRCLALLDEVQRTRRPVTVTRHGRPVARIMPCTSEAGEADNPLRGSVDFEDDLITPVPASWNAGR